MTTTRNWFWLPVILVVLALVYFGWQFTQPKGIPKGFASSNGRIEAVEIDVATKAAGRLVAMYVNEGDFVTAGQMLGMMDTDVLNAELREAQAELRRMKASIDTAKSQVLQRESEKAAAISLVAQRKAELEIATATLSRIQKLRDKQASTDQELDQAKSTFHGADAALKASHANVAASDAAISTAKSQVIQAEASVDSSQAKIERLQADIKDCTLVSPRDSRVQYRIAEPGEVLSAGGKVLNMVDLTDVYMNFFLPTFEAGRVQLGAEAHLVLDAAPQYVIPAKVTYVADVAQFTPKTVETEVERQKLMFRVKAHIDPPLLKEYIQSVKTGLPGVAYVKIDPRVEWPEKLRIRLPK